MKSLQGQLLIASPQLQDPNFARTVVLLVQHDENGALGLILNRALEMTVREALEAGGDEARDYDGDATLSHGGPCPGPLMALHTHKEAAQIGVIDGVQFSAERDSLEWLLANNRGPIRFFAGYSGWGAGQLEGELEAGGWLLAPAGRRHVFDGGEEQWRWVNAELALGREVNPKIVPSDPLFN